MDLQLLNDRILVERFPLDEKIGSIVIPENARENRPHSEGPTLRRGRVLSIGPGKWVPGSWWNVLAPISVTNPTGDKREWEWEPAYRQPIDVRVGEIIIFGPFADYVTQENGAELAIIRESDVLFEERDEALLRKLRSRA